MDQKEKDDLIHSHIHLSDEDIFMQSSQNPALYEIIVWRYQEMFMRKASAMLGSAEDATDAVQETFVRMYVHSDKFHPIVGVRFKSWAYKVLVNQCLNVSKKKRREKEFRVFIDQELQEIIKDTKGLDFEEDRQLSHSLFMLISRLPGILKRAVSLHFVEGKSQKEVAKLEGVSEGAVRARIHRAKRELRRIASDVTFF
jgi:RNA polymerase sigma-70 factor, ECF subfamily